MTCDDFSTPAGSDKARRWLAAADDALAEAERVLAVLARRAAINHEAVLLRSRVQAIRARMAVTRRQLGGEENHPERTKPTPWCG